MTETQKKRITKLRQQGFGYTAIAAGAIRLNDKKETESSASFLQAAPGRAQAWGFFLARKSFSRATSSSTFMPWAMQPISRLSILL